MTEEMIRQRIADIASRELGVEFGSKTVDLAAELDSVQRLTLVVAIEDAFSICFDPDDEEGVITTDDVVALVQRKIPATLRTR